MKQQRFLVFVIVVVVGWHTGILALGRVTVLPDYADSLTFVEFIKTATLDEVDSVKFDDFSLQELKQTMGILQTLSHDSLYVNTVGGQHKIILIFDKIAGVVKQSVASSVFEVAELQDFGIIKMLEDEHFHLGLDPPSKWEKLVHYAKAGRYHYILKRVFAQNYHYYVLGLVLLLAILLYVYKLK